MFNLTKRSMNHFLNFFKVKEDKDETIKQFWQLIKEGFPAKLSPLEYSI
jgi:hypothetical protein